MEQTIKKIPLYPNGNIAYSIMPATPMSLIEWLQYIYKQQSKN